MERNRSCETGPGTNPEQNQVRCRKQRHRCSKALHRLPLFVPSTARDFLRRHGQRSCEACNGSLPAPRDVCGGQCAAASPGLRAMCADAPLPGGIAPRRGGRTNLPPASAGKQPVKCTGRRVGTGLTARFLPPAGNRGIYETAASILKECESSPLTRLVDLKPCMWLTLQTLGRARAKS